MTTGEKVMAALTALSVIAAFWAIRESRSSTKLSEAANRTSQGANTLATEANTLSQTANAYAREANMISQRMYDAENVPRLSFETSMVFTLYAEEGSDRPGFIPIYVIKLKNEGRVAITVTNVAVVNPVDGHFHAFFRNDIDDHHAFPTLPHRLEGAQSLEIPVSMEEMEELRRRVGIEEEGDMVIRAIDPIDRHFESGPLAGRRFDVNIDLLEPIGELQLMMQRINRRELAPEGEDA